MLPEGFYLPAELEEFQQPMIYINTIYNKSKYIDKFIEVAKIPYEENCYQMLINTNGKINDIRSKVTHWDDISYSIIFNWKDKFVHGEINFNNKKYETNNQNEFNGMCKKFVKWSNNLYGLIDKMTSEMAIDS